jgi:starvation-inducible DNA-binding protein
MMFLSNDGDRVRVVKAAMPSNVVMVLRPLLADVYSMVIQAQGAHWNVKGADFSQYHELFGEIYEDVNGSVDPIAESMLKLGADAISSLTEMQAARTTTDKVGGSDPMVLAAGLAAVNDDVLMRVQNAFDVANAANEQGIANFLAERVDMHQKWRWQLRSSIGQSV